MMSCTHGTPGGSRYCALCRHSILAEHGQIRDRRRYLPAGVPMPANFRELVARAREAEARQDALDLDGLE